jgi:hypothetical protein
MCSRVQQRRCHSLLVYAAVGDGFEAPGTLQIRRSEPDVTCLTMSARATGTEHQFVAPGRQNFKPPAQELDG